jgi:hypothetical protein
LTLIPSLHPDEDVFESYAFDRLSEREASDVEEQLLISERCQSTHADTDEKIRLVKAGTPAYVSEHHGALPPQVRFREHRLRWNAAAAAALLFTCLTALLSWRAPLSEPKAVVLDAYRGAASQAPAGQPLEINIDLKDVQPSAGYRVEVVDATGRRVWFGGTPARVSPGLSPGDYWVRLFADTGKLLREYGLKAVPLK